MTAHEPDYAERDRLEQEIHELQLKIGRCDDHAEARRLAEQLARLEALVEEWR